MADLNIRDISPAQRMRWKTAALASGKTLREWVIAKLEGSNGGRDAVIKALE